MYVAVQAVVGAGAAGLAAAKELLAEGHRVTVFEQGPVLGGTWVYTPESDESDSPAPGPGLPPPPPPPPPPRLSPALRSRGNLLLPPVHPQ